MTRPQVRLGPGFQVSTYTTGNQPMDQLTIAADAAGNFVVAWDTNHNGLDADVFAEANKAAQRLYAPAQGLPETTNL